MHIYVQKPRKLSLSSSQTYIPYKKANNFEFNALKTIKPKSEGSERAFSIVCLKHKIY